MQPVNFIQEGRGFLHLVDNDKGGWQTVQFLPQCLGAG